MARLIRRLISTVLAMTLGAAASSVVRAEDIDLFVGTSAAAGSRPNVLVVIDNSANWSRNDQGWADPNGLISPFKQGQSELRALRTVIGDLNDTINFGLMLFTPGATGSKVPTGPGGYVRFHVRQMTAGNKIAFQELIGPDSGCADGANSLNGTPNCIFKNFSGGEQVGTSFTDYSATLFEGFKYFGGYTSPANAQTNVAGSPVDASHFGALRYAGAPEPKSDPGAYGDTGKVTYTPPIDANNSCVKNYVIFIGNGFPTQDSPGALLSGVGGDTTQLAMPQFTTTSTVETSLIGTQCGTGNNSTQRKNNCEANLPQSLKDANPADSYTCVNERVDASACPGGNNRQFDVQASRTVFTVTPTGTSAVPSNNDARFADEWAKYLYTTDVSPEGGQQNAQIYTIDVFKNKQDANQTALLMSMAKYGGGRYFQATSEQAILNALREILIEIQSVNSVFASASLPINATNRAQNENQVFIGMFRPDNDGRPRWYGNLKRYQIALFGAEAKLADMNGAEAVSAATGFVQTCAASFWTQDSGTFWNFSATSAGACTTAPTSPFSDLPDGPLVEKGAAAEVLRRGNDPAAAIPTNAVNRTVLTCPSTGSCTSLVPFNTTNVSQAAVGAANATDHQRIVDFTLGSDVNDENANANLAEVRASVHGDVTHSRPLPISYGGANGVVVFYGANDGTFRASSAADGRELWAFVAPEHHGKLKRLADNSPLITYPTTPPTVPSQSKDYFFDGSIGVYQNADNTQVWIFPTMRRGGRMLYAFDVTTPAVPVLKWRVGCPNPTNDTGCTTGFSGIGQTWSFPNVARMGGVNGGNDPVVVIGGGYDACEDADTSATACGAGPKGNKVFVIDAGSGALLATFNTLRSVAADVTLIDRDFDGLVDHAIVADTGGNLYRIDFSNPATRVPLAPGSWAIHHVARTTGAGRKFQFAPAALATADRIFVALGSGDRERPLQTNYPYVENIANRFYMYVDVYSTSGVPVDLDGATMANFTSNTTCATTLGTSLNGWFMDLNAGRGEQTVTSASIFGGLIFFSTNRPVPAAPGQCGANLGEARGYAVNLLSASGAVNTEALCGGDRSGVFLGGGLPPSPVVGRVLVGTRPVTVMIGGIQRSGGASSPIGAQRVRPVITQRRLRTYWYTHGDR
jgi:type IV pilus assembly protein PilY1